MSETTFIPDWLSAAAQARVDFMIDQMGGQLPDGYAVVLTPLTEPPADFTDEQRERWERTCDNCGTYVPDEVDFMTGSIGTICQNTRIEITFGACAPCVSPPS